MNLLRVTYTDTKTGENLVLFIEQYQLNNPGLLPDKPKKSYFDFCTGRIIDRKTEQVWTNNPEFLKQSIIKPLK